MATPVTVAPPSFAFSQKLVHLDLKGAPPKLDYLEKIFPLLKSWGATGLLVEYEDSFPYTDELSVIHAEDTYSTGDILTLQKLASDNNFTIIPLVQTFGHMEFVLKHSKFRHVREVANFPMAVCPSNPDSLQLVCSMLDQVMAAHSNLRWFHIGCDEVYHLGVCERCRRRQEECGMTSDELFFRHVKHVAQHLTNRYPNVTPIVWDDMFRHSDIAMLRESGLGGLVEPMVWHYLTNFQLPPDLWQRLSAVFPVVWVAGAFKGATGSRACVTSVAYHLDNHLTWLTTLQAHQHHFTAVRGFVLTGWQRYDHFAVLCELLPQALPSLGICLQTLDKGAHTAEAHQTVSDDLGFTSLLPLNPFTCMVIPHCSFPGSSVYQLMIQYAFLEAHCDSFINSDGCLTWMNEFNIRRNFTNPVHLDPIFSAATAKLEQLEEMRSQLSSALSEVFSQSTVDEWLGTHLQPLITKIGHCQQTASKQLALTMGETGTGSS